MHPVDRQVVELALGRIFHLGSRPTQPGDVEEYERCRHIILDVTEGTFSLAHLADTRPNWAADRLKGAQGDA